MSLDGLTLALVEDDPIMGESLTQRLALEGATLSWWRTRLQAIEGLSVVKPNAVICDLKLPDGTGEDVFSSANAQETPPIFLFMTAYADIDQAVRLMKAGAGDYITKPFEMQTLLTRIEGLFTSRRTTTRQSLDLKVARSQAERATIERTLTETSGRVGEAAKRLKISRTTLWARMKALGVSQSTHVRESEHATRSKSE